MKTLQPSYRESYTAIPLQEMSSSISIGDSSQIRLQATNVSSVGDRMLTVGRNIKEAGANAASWMANHPLETALLAGGAVLATGSLLLGVGLSAKAAACACSGFASSFSSNDNASNTTPNTTAIFTAEATSVADFSPTSTTGFTTSFISTSTPCPEPLAVNCSDINSFSFTIAKGQGFALKESSENTLLLHKKPNTLVHDSEFTVDPKEFCVDGIFSEKAFSLHCDADGKDYLLSAESLQAEAPTLETGACAVQTDSTIKQYFDCNKDEKFECKDNAKKACENVQNFKLTIPPYKVKRILSYEYTIGSVFITEKNQNGKDEYRLFFTNYDKESNNLYVDVKTGCEKMLDAPLEFECLGKQSTKIGFTLRQNLTAAEEQSRNFDAGACAFQKTKTDAMKNCSIKFASRSDCGGVLNAQSTCQDKMIVLMSAEVPAEAQQSSILMNAMTPENSSPSESYLLEFANEDSTFITKSDKCYILKRKVKPDYRLRRASNYHARPGMSSHITKIVPEIYNTVDIGYDSLAFSNDTTIPRGYEKPCGFTDIVVNKPEQQDKFFVPLCG